MATPFGRGRFGFQAAQQRRRLAQQRLRLQPSAVQQRWRPFAAFAPRNPWVSLWAGALRQAVAVQRGLAEMRVAELKAIEGALGQFAGGRPMPPLRAGLWGFRPWGQGLASDVLTPYSAAAVSTDAPATTPPPVDTTTTPPAPVETEPMPPAGRKPSTQAIYLAFEEINEKSRDDDRYFTRYGFPRASRVNDMLEDAGHGPASGYARMTAADIDEAWDKFTHEEAYEKREHKGEEPEEGEKGKPAQDDYARAFRALRRGGKKLTRQGYPHEDDVEDYLKEHGFDVRSMSADRMQSAFRKTGDFAEDWQAQEGRPKNGEGEEEKHRKGSHGRESEEDEEKEREHRKPRH
jgi:hypothetical protein